MQFPHSSEEGSVTQRGKETSTVARWAGGKPGRSLPGQHLAPIAVQSVGAVKMQPTASAAKVSCKSDLDAAHGEPATSSLGLTSLTGLTAPLLAAFSEHLSICMKRKSNACLGLDRTAELRAI